MRDILGLNKRAWDKLADNYDERSNTEPSKVFIEFTQMLPLKARVLDLGCGTGIPYSRTLAEKGFSVLGVDISKEMIRVASNNVPEATFIECSMNEIIYKSEFEGILSSFSMLLLSPELFRETASRIYNALKIDGFFYLSLNEPVDACDDPDLDTIVNIMGQEMYSRAYTVDEIENVFKPLGFKLIKFNRDIQISKEFGEEHVIEFIYQKT